MFFILHKTNPETLCMTHVYSKSICNNNCVNVFKCLWLNFIKLQEHNFSPCVFLYLMLLSVHCLVHNKIYSNYTHIILQIIITTNENKWLTTFV